jgi:hypothetical protein
MGEVDDAGDLVDTGDPGDRLRAELGDPPGLESPAVELALIADERRRALERHAGSDEGLRRELSSELDAAMRRALELLREVEGPHDPD